MLGEYPHHAGAIEERLRAARATDHRRHRAERAVGLVCLARQLGDGAAAGRGHGRGRGEPGPGGAIRGGIPVPLDDRAVVALGECLGPRLDPAEPRLGGGQAVGGPRCRGGALRHCRAGRGQTLAWRHRGRG